MARRPAPPGTAGTGWPRRLAVTGHGHPAVRATHGKTFELTADADLTERGTCILAVAADLAALRAGPALAGPVRITLTVGDHAGTVAAVANPFAAPGRRLVVRRSEHAGPDTLAGLADRGAADLDARLLAALPDPATVVRLEAVEAGERPVDNALLAVVPAGTAPPPGTAWATGDDAADRLGNGDHLALAAEPSGLDRRGAELVTAAADLGATVAVAPGPWHVPPVLVAAGVATPAHLDAGLLTGSSRAEAALVAAAAHLPTAARCEGRHLAAVRARLAAHLGPDRAVAVGPHPLHPYRPLDRGRLGGPAPAVAGKATVAIAIAAPPGAERATSADVDRIVALLAAGGVPVRSLAAALAATTGWSRQRSYDHVLQLRGTGTTVAATDRKRG